MSKKPETITIQIDVTKISKDRLYQGKKGKYLDAVLFLRDADDPDQFGRHGVIVESRTMEERDRGEEGPILGNAKRFTRNSQGQGQQAQDSTAQGNGGGAQDDGDDIPF